MEKENVEEDLKKIVNERVKLAEKNEDNLLRLEAMLPLFPNNPLKRLEIIIITFAVRFDLSKAKFPLYMTRDYWRASLHNLN